MELIILRNGSDVVARTNDFTEGATYSLVQTESLPEYPHENLGVGKTWVLMYKDGVFSWEEVDRPLTVEEQLDDAVKGLNVLGVKGDN